MVKVLFSIWISLLTSMLMSQSIYFPAIGDGAPDLWASFGYMEHVPLQIKGDDIDTIYCNNGAIETASKSRYNYSIIPEQLGELKVTLVSSVNGKSDTTSSSITIVERPKLRLVVYLNNETFWLNLLDEENKIVTDKFYSAMEIKLIGEGKSSAGITGKWQEGLKVYELIPKDILEEFEIERIEFRTTALYSREYGLFTGYYRCSMKVGN